MSESFPIERPDLHLKIVQEISDLVNLSTDLEGILRGVVDHVAAALHLDVVSVYLWDASSNVLVLRSTHGLTMNPSQPIRLGPEEGLTGLVYQTRRSLSASPASAHPRYKFFQELGEEEFESYIGVPILLASQALGVLVGQNRRQRAITAAEQTLFEIVASRLAGLLEVADRLDRLKRPQPRAVQSRAHRGKSLSAGFAVGPVYVYRGVFRDRPLGELVFRGLAAETERLDAAIAASQGDLEGVIVSLERQGHTQTEMAIFRALRAMLGDATFHQAMRDRIASGRLPAEHAVAEVVEDLAGQFDGQSDGYLRERASDFRDLGEKILHHLLASQAGAPAPAGPGPGAVLVAHDIGPSLLAALHKHSVAAIVTEQGGETSHTAILAQSLGIPAVAGVKDICTLVRAGQTMLVDGKTGFVFVDPESGLVNEYRQTFLRYATLRERIEAEETGQAGALPLGVSLTANIGFPADIQMARQYGLCDVGLFRTEFTFMQFDQWPSVAQQQAVYERVAGEFDGWVTIRTLDIGADKLLPYFRFPHEDNPLLGLRSIRFSMEYLDLFRDQVRAILSAGAAGRRFRILLPMVSNVWEVETAREVMVQLAGEMGLDAAGLPPLGIMLEVPAVLSQLDDYAPIIDFISVGTNDLIQYLLAVDRNSSIVGHLYSGYHPAVLRTLADVLAASTRLGKEVTVCGELAAAPAGALALLALGYRRLSVLPTRAPLVRRLCKRASPEQLEQVRRGILSERKGTDVQRLLSDWLGRIDPILSEVE